MSTITLRGAVTRTTIPDTEAAIDNFERTCFYQGRDKQHGERRRGLKSGVDRAREKARQVIMAYGAIAKAAAHDNA